MYTYLWLAKDPAGKETAQRVTAPSAQDARAQLEAQGFSDLRLQKDDVMAETTKGSESLQELSPSQEAKVLQEGKATLFKTLFKIARDSLIFLAIIGLWAWWRWFRGRSIWVECAAAIVVVGWIFLSHMNSYQFARLMDAREWHRTKAVLRIVRWIRAVGSLTGVNVPANELARCEAMALTWQGRLDSALARFQQHERSYSDWLYATHVSGLYDSANNFDRGLEWAEKALDLKPDVASSHIDFAWKLLLANRNLPRAQAALDTADKMEVSEIAIPFLIRNRGLLALRQGRLTEAETLLKQSEKIFHDRKNQFFRHSNLMLIKAFLSQTHARMGNIAVARKEFAQARPWLEAADQQRIIEECRAAGV